MNAAEQIVSEALAYFYEATPRAPRNAKNCIWVTAVKLMKLGDPDAIARITAVGHEIGLPETEISDAIGNAAGRTGWVAPEQPDIAGNDIGNDVRDLAARDDPWDVPLLEGLRRPDEAVRPEFRCLHDPMCACAGNGWCGCPECKRMDAWERDHEYDQRWGYYIAKAACEYDSYNHCWVKKA